MTKEPFGMDSLWGEFYNRGEHRGEELFWMCGWLPEEIQEARRLGYSPHVRAITKEALLILTIGQARELTRGDFWHWVEHHYRQCEAKALKLSMAEFVSLWRRLLSLRLEIDEESGPAGASERIIWYMRARRSGLDDSEALIAMTFCKDDFNSYLFLRRKLSQAWVRSIIDASRRNGISWTLARKPENVLKALRRGATIDDIVAHVEKGTLDG